MLKRHIASRSVRTHRILPTKRRYSATVWLTIFSFENSKTSWVYFGRKLDWFWT